MKLRPQTFAVAAGIIGAAWYFLLFAPVQQKLITAHVEVASASSQFESLLMTLRNVPDQLKTERGLDSLREALNKSLFATNEIERLFSEFTDEAESYNLKVTELTPSVEELLALDGPEKKKNSAPFLNFSVRMTGQFADFGKFMERLEESPFFQGVNKVTINLDPNQQLTFFMDMRALLQEPGKRT